MISCDVKIESKELVHRNLLLYTTYTLEKAVNKGELGLVSIIGSYDLSTNVTPLVCSMFLQRVPVKKGIEHAYKEYLKSVGRELEEQVSINFKNVSSHRYYSNKNGVLKVVEVHEWLVDSGTLHAVYTYTYK